ncbi:MAG: hypothetical protein OXH67_04670 [Acidimicrobiaceae bacterium]|nr:hypothetical protein [Acidimicrobiaceae bacterium]
MYRPDDRYVWDFWLARDEGTWHMFHLQAPRTLAPDDRHWHATVGHATSTDLRSWTPLASAIETGPPGEWDGLAIWTGSVIRHLSGRWLMAYTGIAREGARAVERIGLAWSDDLITWSKDPANPVIESDPLWYEEPGDSEWQHGWRDPCLVCSGQGYAMLISARVKAAAAPGLAGAVALAISPDGHTWKVMPPIEGTTGHFAQIEIPHLVHAGDLHHLVFCTNSDRPWPSTDPDATVRVGTGAFSGPHALGPYRRAPAFIDADESGSRYGGRVFETGNGRLAYMAFLDGGSGAFQGAITDSSPVSFDTVAGRLRGPS